MRLAIVAYPTAVPIPRRRVVSVSMSLSSHSQTTSTLHPADRSSSCCLASRSTFRRNFSVQKPVLVRGVVV